VEKQNGDTMGAHKMVAGSAVPVPSVGGSASDSLSVAACHFHENTYLDELIETRFILFQHLMLRLDYEDAKSKHL
jgi:hypothetical protein